MDNLRRENVRRAVWNIQWKPFWDRVKKIIKAIALVALLAVAWFKE